MRRPATGHTSRATVHRPELADSIIRTIRRDIDFISHTRARRYQQKKKTTTTKRFRLSFYVRLDEINMLNTRVSHT